MLRINVERFSVTSRKSFRDVMASLHTAVGHPDMDGFRKSVSATKAVAGMEQAICSAVGPSGFMKLIRFDRGEVMHEGEKTEIPGIVRRVIGNPLIMRQIVRHVPDPGSYAPLTILVDERPDGEHLSLDTMARLLATYESPEPLKIAQELDTKLEAPLAAAS